MANVNGVTPPHGGERTTSLPGARAALILLLIINLFNYIDRQILSAVLPHLRGVFLADDPNAQTKLGALTTAFMVAYMVLAPLFGWLGDRMARWVLVGIGVILWSLASGASGLATSYLMLLGTRCLVGVGEAAYGPVAPTLISDLYPVAVRGKVLAWFYAAIPVGSALGFVLGGAVGDWRMAFYLVVPPGILLGLWCFFMREPPRGQADMQGGAAAKAKWKDYLVLLRIPSYVLDTLGMTAFTFALGGLAAWMPYYVLERQGIVEITSDALSKMSSAKNPVAEFVAEKLAALSNRSFTYREFEERLQETLSLEDRQRFHETIIDHACSPSLQDINIKFGVIVVVSGLVATLLGGMAGDWLRPRVEGAYFLVSGVSMLIAFPFLLLVIWTPFPLAWVFVFLAVFMLFLNTGPTNTILANVTHPAIRASGFAINIFIIHALGDAISPLVIGAIADQWDLNVAFFVVSFVVLIGGLLWLRGARYLDRDTALATSRLDGPM